MKDNAVYHVAKVLVDKTKKKNPKGVVKEQLITLGYKDPQCNTIRIKLAASPLLLMTVSNIFLLPTTLPFQHHK